MNLVSQQWAGGSGGWRWSSWPQGLGSAEPLGLRCPLHAGNGYCRSEAVVVMLLTKKSLARRVYATILNAGINTDGCKEQGGCRPRAGGARAGLRRAVISWGLRPGSSHRCDLPLRGGTGAAHALPVRASWAGPRVPRVYRSPRHRHQGESPTHAPRPTPERHRGRVLILLSCTGGRSPGAERH